jgi:hypothetical protein
VAVAESAFNSFDELSKLKYTRAAEAAVNHIVTLEPLLLESKNERDILFLELSSDNAGMQGDVRDLILKRPMKNWEIGISAKNNHKAVKHSRLSNSINFGKEWVDLPCSAQYFTEVELIFNELSKLKKEDKLWRELENKVIKFYVPLLQAFSKELLQLDRSSPGQVPAALLQYLIGRKDFYKIVKRRNSSEIYGFQMYGTLNRSGSKLPIYKVPKLKLPTRIIELSFKEKKQKDTLLLTCDEGWQIAFRIHNASSRVEPSLKFDINLVGQPQGLYSNYVLWA